MENLQQEQKQSTVAHQKENDAGLDVHETAAFYPPLYIQRYKVVCDIIEKNHHDVNKVHVAKNNMKLIVFTICMFISSETMNLTVDVMFCIRHLNCISWDSQTMWLKCYVFT